jgi:hypothetical protein
MFGTVADSAYISVMTVHALKLLVTHLNFSESSRFNTSFPGDVWRLSLDIKQHYQSVWLQRVRRTWPVSRIHALVSYIGEWGCGPRFHGVRPCLLSAISGLLCRHAPLPPIRLLTLRFQYGPKCASDLFDLAGPLAF